MRRSGREKELLAVVIEQALEALLGQTYLSWDEQKRCREAIQGPAYFERVFVTSALRVSPVFFVAEELVVPDGGRLSISSHRGWSFQPQGFAGEEGEINYLAPRPRAWFTVLHDLMALSKGNHIVGAPLVPKPFELPWVSVSGGPDGKTYCWPTPAWPSFRHFDLLGFAWNKVVNQISQQRRNLDESFVARLAYHWIRYITSLLSLAGEDLKEEPRDEVSEADWQALVQKTGDYLRSVQDRTAPDDDLVRNWLIDLDVFLAPESAIPDSVRGFFLQNEELREFWDSQKDEILSRQGEQGAAGASQVVEPVS